MKRMKKTAAEHFVALRPFSTFYRGTNRRDRLFLELGEEFLVQRRLYL